MCSTYYLDSNKKFELAMHIKSNWNILEGEEYKLLEYIFVDRD